MYLAKLIAKYGVAARKAAMNRAMAERQLIPGNLDIRQTLGPRNLSTFRRATHRYDLSYGCAFVLPDLLPACIQMSANRTICLRNLAVALLPLAILQALVM